MICGQVGKNIDSEISEKKIEFADFLPSFQ